MWVAADGKRPAALRLNFQSRERLFSIFPNTQGPVMVDSLPQRSTLIATYYVVTVLPEVIKAIRQQRQIVGTSKTLFFHGNASAHKSKVIMIFPKAQNIQVLSHSPYSPHLAQCDFWLFPLIKKKRRKKKKAGWIFSRSKFRAPCIVSIRLSNCLWSLAQTSGTVCAKRRRVGLLWRNVVGKSDRYFQFYWPADIT